MSGMIVDDPTVSEYSSLCVPVVIVYQKSFVYKILWKQGTLSLTSDACLHCIKVSEISHDRCVD